MSSSANIAHTSAHVLKYDDDVYVDDDVCDDDVLARAMHVHIMD